MRSIRTLRLVAVGLLVLAGGCAGRHTEGQPLSISLELRPDGEQSVLIARVKNVSDQAVYVPEALPRRDEPAVYCYYSPDASTFVLGLMPPPCHLIVESETDPLHFTRLKRGHRIEYRLSVGNPIYEDRAWKPAARTPQAIEAVGGPFPSSDVTRVYLIVASLPATLVEQLDVPRSGSSVALRDTQSLEHTAMTMPDYARSASRAASCTGRLDDSGSLFELQRFSAATLQVTGVRVVHEPR